MKNLLSILLLCFCFYATAQNASTIQQLLDDGVTVGELLDAGVTIEEFYGMEHEDGVIFDIDTINGIGRIALITDKSLPFQCFSGSYQYPSISIDENNGLLNTESIASSCIENVTGSSYAIDYVSNSGMNDWYIPTRNDFELINQNLILNHFWPNITHSFMTSVNYGSDRYWTARFRYSSSTDEDCCYWNDEARSSNSKIMLVRDFDLNNHSASYFLTTISNNDSLLQLINSGVLVDELYGLEYEDGVIFDIDTINGIGRIALITDKSLPFQCFSGSYQYPSISIDENNGLLNTESIASSCIENVTGSSYAIDYVSNSGMNDWYIPTRNDFELINQNLILNHFWPNITHSFMTSVNYGSDRYWTARFRYSSSTDEDCCYWNDYVRSSNSKIMLVRDFDLNSPSVPELSPALQSFLESYTPPVVEDEEVSDANSFDVLNPLSYNGEFETVFHDFNQGSFQVPNGKTLVIQTLISHQGDSYITFKINNNDFFEDFYNTYNNFNLPIFVGSNETIGMSGESQASFSGILIDTQLNVKHVSLPDYTGNYTVPDGKTYIITNISGSEDGNIYVDGVRISRRNFHYRLTQPLYIGSNHSISGSSTGSCCVHIKFSGILVDNSNYSYATDYELINALNEGMDSLSTMSEVVVQENDSLTTENAILSQENEALMAIDYNFDSLQYVADFLSSQVFDLQQELLVPNIDVDMAIGWNMVGFSCPQQRSAEDALVNIVDNLIIFKNNNGNVYMPEFSFNGIGDLTPGHGYQLKVTDYILDFNICE